MEEAYSIYDYDVRKTIVIIPAYKPIDILKEVVRKLYEEDFIILVVDDGSGEEYKKIFDYVGQYAIVLRHTINQGKGNALKTAYQYIFNNFSEFEAVVTADADGQHKVEDIVKLSNSIIDNDNKIIIGSRSFTGKVPLRSRIGNDITRIVFANASKMNISDTQTGLRAFKMNILPEMIEIEGSRYEYEMNVLLWAAANNIDVKEEPIETIYDCENNPSHFRVIKDSARIYSSVIKFTLSSFTAFCIDFVLLLLFNAIFKSVGMSSGESLFVSTILARIFSSTYNYAINKIIVFKSKEKVSKTGIQYFTLVSVIALVNFCFLYLLNIIIGIKLDIAKIIVELTLFIASYYAQKKIIFNK